MKRHISLVGNEWQATGWYTKQWRLHASMELHAGIPPVVPAIQATVPGAIQADLLRAGWLNDPNIGLQSLDMEWVNNRDWVLERRFRIPQGWVQDRCELVFEGLDDVGEIYLNRQRIAEFEGMFKPVVLDVTGRLRTGADEENVLQVVFFTAPYVDGQIGHSHTIDRLKSRFNYAWDWCPRMVPVGIWRNVFLRTFTGVKIVDFFPEATLGADLRQGVLKIHQQVEVVRPGAYRAAYRMVDGDGVERWVGSFDLGLGGGMREINHEAKVGAVETWWPNGYGEHPTYQVEVTILDRDSGICDTASKTVGFRTVEWVRNEGAPEDSLPYTPIVNGHRIFLNGVNWVPLTPFYGTVRPEEYGPFLERFAQMNANLLRVWGGGIYEHEAFYDECDRLGLLVWQEFLQSSSGLTNSPPDNPPFLRKLEEVSRVGVLALRSHPSLVIWCGGNELAWEGHVPVDERHLNIKMLKGVVQELDATRQFFPTSPSGPRFNFSLADVGKGVHHDIHGPWNYLGDGAHYEEFNRDDSQFRSETGAPGASRWEAIQRYAGNCDVWPPKKDNPYWLHRGSWWIQWDQLGRLFGPWREEENEIGPFLQASRYLQMESLRYAVEATRRREPQASGFIVWMGNEPYPNNTNTSVIEFDGTPKPAYYALKQAFASRSISLRYDRVAYRSGERFVGRIFLRDEGSVSGNWAVRVRLLRVDGEVLKEKNYAANGGTTVQEREAVAARSGTAVLELGAAAASGASTVAATSGTTVRESETATANGGTVAELGTLMWDVQPCPHDVFLLRAELLDEEGQLLSSHDYLFTVDASYPLQPLRRLPPAQVELSSGDRAGELVVANRSQVVAAGVFMYGKDASQFLHIDRNALVLLPGEQAVIQCSAPSVRPEQLIVEGLNVRRRGSEA